MENVQEGTRHPQRAYVEVARAMGALLAAHATAGDGAQWRMVDGEAGPFEVLPTKLSGREVDAFYRLMTWAELGLNVSDVVPADIVDCLRIADEMRQSKGVWLYEPTSPTQWALTSANFSLARALRALGKLVPSNERFRGDDNQPEMLTDAERMAAAHPETFEIPTLPEREALMAGDLAKIGIEGDDDEGIPGERFYVKIVGKESTKDGWHYTGKLRHDLIEHPMKAGDVIPFEPRHVMDIVPRSVEVAR